MTRSTTQSGRWTRLACFCAVLLTPVTPVLGVSSAGANGELDKVWRNYLANESHHTPIIEFPHTLCFKRSAAAHDLPVTLLLAVARGESDFDSRAISSANALGVMQILWPGTARHLGITQRKALFKPCINIDAGARYLREMLSRYGGNLHRALAAYNYGPGRISVQGTAMPKGARWYSGYIYRHLEFVLASSRQPGTGHKYTTEKKFPLITFKTPYRARAFVTRLGTRMARISHPARLDWFRVGRRAFRVVLLYNSTRELERGRQALSNAGFSSS